VLLPLLLADQDRDVDEVVEAQSEVIVVVVVVAEAETLARNGSRLPRPLSLPV
jgi:hypothetical protein